MSEIIRNLISKRPWRFVCVSTWIAAIAFGIATIWTFDLRVGLTAGMLAIIGYATMFVAIDERHHS